MDIVGYAKKANYSEPISSKSILSNKYKLKMFNLRETATHLFETIDPNYISRVVSGDFIVAGENFGYGSVQEAPILAIQSMGVVGIIAKSFSSHFERIAINLGLMLIVADTDYIADRDFIEVYLKEGVLRNTTRTVGLKIKIHNNFIRKMYKAGGLVEYYLKNDRQLL